MQEHASERKAESPAGPAAEAPSGAEGRAAESRQSASQPAESPQGEPQPAESPRGESQPGEARPDAGGAEAAEPGAAQAVPLAALATSDLVQSFLSLLALKAWEGMGLVPNAVSGKTQKNLDDARLAIDAYAAVFEILRPRIEDAPRREMENLLTTLRLNFVDKSAG